MEVLLKRSIAVVNRILNRIHHTASRHNGSKYVAHTSVVAIIILYGTM